MLNNMRNMKKGVMGPVISVFVLVLVVSILAGVTFLFVAQLKTQSVENSRNSQVSVINESVTISATNVAQSLSASTKANVLCNPITYIANQTTTGASLALGNLTQTQCSVINTSMMNAAGTGNNRTVYVSYTYLYTDANQANAYSSINATESAGYTLVGYLPLIFLAIIFGAILTLVLKVILPYVNLGQSVGGF